MLLGTQTDRFCSAFGEVEGVKLLCKAGFDAIDLSLYHMHDPKYPWLGDTWRTTAEAIKYIAREHGVVFHQAHAPFPSYVDGDEAYNEKNFKAILRCMEITSYIGAKTLIVHPIYIANVPDLLQRNVDFFNRLQPYCAQYGLKIALENMWGWDEEKQKIYPTVCSFAKDFATYIDAMDRRYFTACLDIGHCGLVGETAADAIRILGHDRLTTLHVHDNDNIQDLHTAPYDGKIDWEAVTTALVEIDYRGVFTLEADNFFLPYQYDMLPTAAISLRDTGRKLIKIMDAKRANQKVLSLKP